MHVNDGISVTDRWWIDEIRYRTTLRPHRRARRVEGMCDWNSHDSAWQLRHIRTDPTGARTPSVMRAMR